MKTMLKYSVSAWLSFSLMCALSFTMPADAQDKISPRLDVAYYQVDTGVCYLAVKVRKRIEKRFYPIADAEVHLSMEFPDETFEIGSVTTSDKGEGKLVLPGRLLTKMKDLDEYFFVARFSGTDSLEEVSESVVIKPSRLKVETDDADRSIRIMLEAKTDGIWEPFEGAELSIFIKRRFGRILVGEEFNTTDENGAVELTFDTEIPGDENGFLVLECAIEDNDELGNVYATTAPRWGIPLVMADKFHRRTLWGTRDKTPWWLLVFPNVMIAGVWGVIVYLVILIVKMKRLSRNAD